jgi:hypothetical protein
MSGFGVHVGGGHLNNFGHEIYADILTDAIVAHAADLKSAARAAR